MEIVTDSMILEMTYCLFLYIFFSTDKFVICGFYCWWKNWKNTLQERAPI